MKLGEGVTMVYGWLCDIKKYVCYHAHVIPKQCYILFIHRATFI